MTKPSKLTYLSLFSGVGSDAIALGELGFQALAFSEIEPFQSAVLKHHYPDVPNLGDALAVDWGQYRGKAALVIGGPPCPSFSTSGNVKAFGMGRQSLDDARGQLLLKYVEICDEVKPDWTVLENVVGLLSATGNAFGCFLARLVGAASPLVPPGRWPRCGMVAGPKRAACWRVLSSEYHGLPQRRQRLFVVGHSIDWSYPAKILLEPKSDCGLSENRGPDMEEIAPPVKTGLHKGSWNIKPDQPLTPGFYIYDRLNNTVSPVAPAIGTNCGLSTGRTVGIQVNDDLSITARRLVPEEIERLQGLPSGWTDIPWKGGKAPDSLRYRACGNAFPPQFVSWIGSRIKLIEQEK